MENFCIYVLVLKLDVYITRRKGSGIAELVAWKLEFQILVPTNVSLKHCLFELPTDGEVSIYTYVHMSFRLLNQFNLNECV
jgi:hypothetical protein